MCAQLQVEGQRREQQSPGEEDEKKFWRRYKSTNVSLACFFGVVHISIGSELLKVWLVCRSSTSSTESRATPTTPFSWVVVIQVYTNFWKRRGMRFTSSPARHVYSISYISIRGSRANFGQQLSVQGLSLSLHRVYIRYSYRVCRLCNQKQNGKPVGAQCSSTAHARAIEKASRLMYVRVRDLFSGLDII
jgi:hypothetical protein